MGREARSDSPRPLCRLIYSGIMSGCLGRSRIGNNQNEEKIGNIQVLSDDKGDAILIIVGSFLWASDCYEVYRTIRRDGRAQQICARLWLVKTRNMSFNPARGPGVGIFRRCAADHRLALYSAGVCMTTIAYPFLIFSAVGLVLSVISHVCGLRGAPGPLGDQTWLLHIGIFVVWLPAVLAVQRLSRNVPRRDVWNAALRGCPRWMRYGMYGLFGYAIINFLIFIQAGGKHQGPGPMPPAVVRGFPATGWFFMVRHSQFFIHISNLEVRIRSENVRPGMR